MGCDKNGMKKGPWTPEEDQKLLDYIQKHGYGSWRTLSKNAGLARCGKSCRLRWTNYLRPDIKRGRFSFEEEEAIIQLHSILGNKWSAIAARLPGRTDNEIKNYWNTHIRKRLLRMGIDPVTHSPRLDLLDLSSLLGSSIYDPNQIDISRLLGIEPLVDSELIRLATALLSSQGQNSNFISQGVIQEQQFPTSQTMTFPEFQPNQLQSEIQACTTSDAQLLSEAQIMQANVGQFQPDAQSNAWQESQSQPVFPSNLMPSADITSYQNNMYNMLSEGAMNFDDPRISQNCNFTSDLSRPPSSDNLNSSSTQYYNPNSVLSTPDSSSHLNSSSNYNPTSVLSTPASSPTHDLNSSSTYFTSGTEDDMNSYCSDLFNFQVPDLLDVVDFL